MRLGIKKVNFIIFLFLMPTFFSCFKNTDYLDPSKRIINVIEYYKIYDMPLKFKRKIPNCNITLFIYSFINDNEIFEHIYNSIYYGIEILNDYLNFGKEVYIEKDVKWNIYLTFIDLNIKNKKYLWKNEYKNDAIYYKNILKIEKKKEKWQKNINSICALYIHELCHKYFDFYHNKYGFKYKMFYAWFEEGFAKYLEYIIRSNFEESKKYLEIQFERVKKDRNIYKDIWSFVPGKMVKQKNINIFFMKMLLFSKIKIKDYIDNFWRHFDDLYFLSAKIVMTMEEYYGKEKFKEILRMYRDGIEREKLKKMAEEAIKANW